MSKIKVLYFSSYRPSLLIQVDVEINVYKAECVGSLSLIF